MAKTEKKLPLLKFDPYCADRAVVIKYRSRGLFLERPGNFSGPKSCFIFAAWLCICVSKSQ